MKKNIGVTLLLVQKNKNKFKACLISIIFNFVSIVDLEKKISEHLLRYNIIKQDSDNISAELTYLGIYDAYLVSDVLSENYMIGKTSYDELKTKMESRTLIKSIEKYHSKMILKTACDDFISEIIFHYSDKQRNDSRTVIAKLHHRNTTFQNVIDNLLKQGKKQEFKEKIFKFNDVNENLDLNKIVFIGVADVYPLSKFAIQFGGVEAIYKNFNYLEDVRNVLPNQMDVFDFLKV